MFETCEIDEIIRVKPGIGEILEVPEIYEAIGNSQWAVRIPRPLFGLQNHMANSSCGDSVCERVACNGADCRGFRNGGAAVVESPDPARYEGLRAGDVKGSCDGSCDVLVDDYQVQFAGTVVEY